MKIKEEQEHRLSWFWKWFLNNKAVTGLLVVLLCLLIVLTFTKVSYLFEPVWQFFGVVGLPIVLSGILYYMLNPVVNWLEKKKIKRIWGITILFILIITLLTWGIVVLIPKLQEQTTSFIKNAPSYWHIIESKSNELFASPIFEQFRDPIEQASQNMFNSIGNTIQQLSKNAFQGIGSLVGAVANVVLALVTMPFILFYLLKDGKRLPEYFIKFLPNKVRKPTLNVLTDINKQVSQYIRGQLTVAFSVAVIFIIAFSLIGLEYSVTLGIMAGFLNLIPYLGSALAMIPAILLGIVAGPAMLIKVIIVFIVEQTIEGRFISPLVLGSQMNIHPVTIIFVLLTSGKLFGVVGVILGLPGYAAIKVLVTHIFEWYREVSSLYEEEQDDPDIITKTQKEN